MSLRAFPENSTRIQRKIRIQSIATSGQSRMGRLEHTVSTCEQQIFDQTGGGGGLILLVPSKYV